MFNLEYKLHTAENYLSFVTAIPVLGVIGGVCKVILGITQAISAFVIAFFTAFATIFGSEKGKDYFLRASKHIVHGLGNIVAGVIESIPFVGLLGGYIRYLSWNSAHPPGPGVGNYLAYGDLYDYYSGFNDAWEGIGWKDTRPLPLIKV